MLSRSLCPSWLRLAPEETGWRRIDSRRRRKLACSAFRQLAAHSRVFSAAASDQFFVALPRESSLLQQESGTRPCPLNPSSAKNASGIGWLSPQAMLNCRSEQETL